MGAGATPTPTADGEFLVCVPALCLFLSQTWPRTWRALVSVWASLRDQISVARHFPSSSPSVGTLEEGLPEVGDPPRAGGAQQDCTPPCL